MVGAEVDMVDGTTILDGIVYIDLLELITMEVDVSGADIEGRMFIKNAHWDDGA